MTKPLQIQQHASLKPFNTFGIEVKAHYFAPIESIDHLSELLAQKTFHGMPKFILGDGSNILFTKDYEGLVIKNAIKGIQPLSEDDDHIWIQVGAGENWHDFVMYCVEKGYGGVENLSLIPGTVGAAPIQNIGAYGAELSDTFHQLIAANLSDGSIRLFSQEECQLGYRDSVFKNQYKNQYVILAVTFRLNKKPKFRVDYGNLKETLQQMQVKELSIKAISDAVIQIRRSKLPDPKELGNAGSFFKNPLTTSSHLNELRKQYPDMPHFPTQHEDSVKIPAAWLIEQCGWKGKRQGNVGIHDKQALILVNYGAGNSAEIQKLAHEIQQTVYDKFQIKLTPEVNLI